MATVHCRGQHERRPRLDHPGRSPSALPLRHSPPGSDSGTFTSTGTGRFSAQSAGAELLVCGQVVLGWTFVAVLLAMLVPRAAAAAYKRQSNGRIIVRVGKPER